MRLSASCDIARTSENREAGCHLFDKLRQKGYGRAELAKTCALHQLLDALPIRVSVLFTELYERDRHALRRTGVDCQGRTDLAPAAGWAQRALPLSALKAQRLPSCINRIECRRCWRSPAGLYILQLICGPVSCRRETEGIIGHCAASDVAVVVVRTSTSSSANCCAFASASDRPFTCPGSSSWSASRRTNRAL